MIGCLQIKIISWTTQTNYKYKKSSEIMITTDKYRALVYNYMYRDSPSHLQIQIGSQIIITNDKFTKEIRQYYQHSSIGKQFTIFTINKDR